MARRGGASGGGGGGGRSSTGALFDPDFRQAFLDWLVREQGKSVKSSQEYYYQLSDVTRTIHERAGLPAPAAPMTQLRVQEFVLAHADAYTAVVLERKRAGKKTSFLEHLKHFLGLRSLVLPPRKDPKRVNPGFKQSFLGWLARERDVDGTKTAKQHYYSTCDLARRLYRRVYGENGEQGHENGGVAGGAPSAASSVAGAGSVSAGEEEEEEGGEEDEEDAEESAGGGARRKGKGTQADAAVLESLDKEGLRALVLAVEAQGALGEVLRPLAQRKRPPTFLNHLSAYLALPCLALAPHPPPSRRPADPGPLHPALKAAFSGWAQRERCVAGRTAQQYAREVGRVVKKALEDDAGPLRAAEAEGALACLLRAPAVEGEEGGNEEEGGAGFEKAAVAAVVQAHLPAFTRANEAMQKKMRGWATFKEFLGLVPPTDVKAKAAVVEEEDGGGAESEDAAAVAADAAEAEIDIPGVDENGLMPPSSSVASMFPFPPAPAPVAASASASAAETEAEKEAVPEGAEAGAGGKGKGRKRPRPRVKAEEGGGAAGARAGQQQQGRARPLRVPIFLTPQLQGEYLAWLATEEGRAAMAVGPSAEGQEQEQQDEEDEEEEEVEAARRACLDGALKMAWKIYRAVHPRAPVPTTTTTTAAGAMPAEATAAAGTGAAAEEQGAEGEGAANGGTMKDLSKGTSQRQEQGAATPPPQRGLDREGVLALLRGHDAAARRVERAYPSMRGYFAVFYRFVTGEERVPEPEDVAEAAVAAERAARNAAARALVAGGGGGEEDEEGMTGASAEEEYDGMEEESMEGVELNPNPNPDGAGGEGAFVVADQSGVLEVVKRQPPGDTVWGKKRRLAGKRGRRTPEERLAAVTAEAAELRRENDRLADQVLVLRRQKEEAERAAARREAELLRRIEELGGDTRGLALHPPPPPPPPPLPVAGTGGGAGPGFRGAAGVGCGRGGGASADVAAMAVVVGAAGEPVVEQQQHPHQAFLPPPPPPPPLPLPAPMVVPLPEPKDGGMGDIHV